LKEFLADQLTEDWEKLDNKVRFVTEIIQGRLVVQNRKRADILDELRRRGYKALTKHKKGEKPNEADGDENENAGADDVNAQTSPGDTTATNYDYLLSMAIWSLTTERVRGFRPTEDDDRSIKCAKNAMRSKKN
jgi:DNA topoisomerase-2